MADIHFMYDFANIEIPELHNVSLYGNIDKLENFISQAFQECC